MRIGKRAMHEAIRVALGIALLILVAGIWVCLWVPPSF